MPAQTEDSTPPYPPSEAAPGEDRGEASWAFSTEVRPTLSTRLLFPLQVYSPLARRPDSLILVGGP
jgi:hypothetical protein